jgi:hypothetical protein
MEFVYNTSSETRNQVQLNFNGTLRKRTADNESENLLERAYVASLYPIQGVCGLLSPKALGQKAKNPLDV